MAKFLGSKNGNAVMLSMMAVGAIVVGGYMFLQKATDKLNLVQGTTNDWKLDLLSKKASMLGSYLVSNSLILCKEEVFATKQKCTWAGSFLNPQIPLASFGLSKATDASDTTVLTYDFAVVEASLNEALPSGKNIQISFDLVNWQNSSDLKSFVGTISEDVKKVDDDAFLVLMKVRVPYKGNTAGQGDGYYETFAAIKRPLAIPKLEVRVASPCASGCPSSVGENPFPECRGKQEVPDKSTSAYALTFVNTGPGAIYKASYERNISFTSLNPGQAAERTSLNLLVGKDFIMPNDSFQVSDTVVCFQPKTIQNEVQTVENKTEYEYGYGGIGGSVTTSEITSDKTTLNQHLQTMANVQYNLTPGNRLTSYMTMEPNKSTMTVPAAAGDVKQLVNTYTREYTVTNTTVQYISPH